jgi:integrase-like protein
MRKPQLALNLRDFYRGNMSALGQKRTYATQNGMSALPPIATTIASSESPVVNRCRSRGFRIFDFYPKSCGYKLANNGQDTRAIQHYLGHKSINSTVRYTALAPDRFKGFWKD